MDLAALALFHSVAEHGGFSAAARATGRPKATLSRRISDLERELGVRLFERGVRSLHLTEEGRGLLAGTHGPLDEIAAAGRALGGGVEPRGRLRVSVPLMFAQQMIGGFAARFHARHPQVRLEVVADDRYVDLVEEGFDVAIRAKPKPTEALVGRCVLRDRLVLVAAPEFARPRPSADETTPTPIAAIVRAFGDEVRLWTAETDGGCTVFAPEPVLRLSTLAIRDAVRAGAGVALFPSYFVRDDLAEGRLVSWGTLVGDPLEFWMLHVSARHVSSKVRAFSTMLAETLASARA